MKNLLFIIILASNLQLLCMEKDRQIFPWDQLSLDLKTEILKKTFAINAQSSIDSFKKIRLISKEFNTKQSITAFLEALNVKFPGQEIRFARALHNQYAKEWLNKKYLHLVYEPIPFQNNKEVAIDLMLADNLAGLEKLLLDGYNPQDIKSYALLFAKAKSKLPFLKLLISFGAKAIDPVDLSWAQHQIQLAERRNIEPELVDALRDILDYLITESDE